MEIYILDSSYTAISVIDTFESFIWTERYNNIGDFEFYAPVNISGFDTIQIGNYVYRKDTEKIMRIDTIQITTDAEDGDHIIVTGESLESILKHYVVYPGVTFNANFQAAIMNLLQTNIISPPNNKRKISNFRFKYSNDPNITNLNLDGDYYYYGDNLFDVIQSLCSEYNVGFHILLDDDGGYAFELYAGVNRSYSQEETPWVVFSPKLDNFNSSNYIESDKDYASSCFVVGEITITKYQVVEDAAIEIQEDIPIYQEVTLNSDDIGIKRREKFLDVGKLDTDTVEEAQNQMISKAKEELSKYEKISDFEGVVEPYRQYIFGRDYFVGDIVQVVNRYGREGTSRVSEVIYSLDVTGERLIPTFTAVKN